MTAENVMGAQSADQECEDCGYEPELKRTLGSFQVFAISFAFISVAVGIFGTYDDVLRNAGPVGIWLWVIAAVGQTLVALVIAQFAARIPLSGSVLSMGLAAGQPEDRLGVRLADRSATWRSASWRSTMRWPARPSCRCSAFSRTRARPALITLVVLLDPGRAGHRSRPASSA